MLGQVPFALQAVFICSASLVVLLVWHDASIKSHSCPPAIPQEPHLEHATPQMQLGGLQADNSFAEQLKILKFLPFSPGLLAPFVVSLEEGTTPT